MTLYIQVTFLWNTNYTDYTCLYFLLQKTDIFSPKDINDLMAESLKMQKFDHRNVLNLIGVCIDAGPAPYLLLPFMAAGSLLSYLKKERPHLTIAPEASEELVSG